MARYWPQRATGLPGPVRLPAAILGVPLRARAHVGGAAVAQRVSSIQEVLLACWRVLGKLPLRASACALARCASSTGDEARTVYVRRVGTSRCARSCACVSARVHVRVCICLHVLLRRVRALCASACMDCLHLCEHEIVLKCAACVCVCMCAHAGSLCHSM